MHLPEQVIYEVGVQKQRPPIPSSCPADLASLIKTCWDQDPAMRPAFSTILLLLKVSSCCADMRLAQFSGPGKCPDLDSTLPSSAATLLLDKSFCYSWQHEVGGKSNQALCIALDYATSSS